MSRLLGPSVGLSVIRGLSPWSPRVGQKWGPGKPRSFSETFSWAVPRTDEGGGLPSLLQANHLQNNFLMDYQVVGAKIKKKKLSTTKQEHFQVSSIDYFLNTGLHNNS